MEMTKQKLMFDVIIWNIPKNKLIFLSMKKYFSILLLVCAFLVSTLASIESYAQQAEKAPVSVVYEYQPVYVAMFAPFTVPTPNVNRAILGSKSQGAITLRVGFQSIQDIPPDNSHFRRCNY